MSLRVGHASLSSAASAWLAALSDPWARAPAPTGQIQAAEFPLFIEAALAHGVLPAVARNLQGLAVGGHGKVLFDDASTQHFIESCSKELSQRLVILAGRNLLLARHAANITATFASEAVPAALVKGPVFARRLYPQPADRSFTDIDILIAPSSLPASFSILERLGFIRAAGNTDHGREHDEFKWILPGNDLILVEIQTDLIHSPNLGTGIRFNYGDLLAAGNGDSEDATALLLVAAVHGAAGHQFERLQLAVDVLQAARGVAGPIDRRRLVQVAHATGSTVAVQAALDLVHGIFDEPLARELADTLSSASWRRLRRGLVSRRVVLRAQAYGAGRDSWRRRALREIIRRGGKATIRHTAR